MKKIAGRVLLIISLLLVAFFLAQNIGTERYNDVIVSDEEFEHIISLRTEASGLVQEILFDEESLFCDEINDIYYYSLVENSSTSSNPHIKLVANNKMKIAFLNEEISEDIIKNNVTIKFIVYSDEYYQQYGLRCTTLPLMSISCSEEIGDENVKMDILLFDNRMDAPNRVIASGGTIHVRGASTRVFPKKNYRISLVQTSLGNNKRDNNMALLGMRQDDDWLLHAAYSEPTKVHNVFSCNLWKNSCSTNNSLGVDTGMEYRYLELFINHEYYGLYALGYPIDCKQLELKQGTGDLYKKVLWATEASLNGYSKEGYGDENRDYLQEFYEYLDTNKYNKEALMSYVDINNLIDIRLFFNLIQGEDNVGTILYHRGQNSTYLKNVYLCIRETGDGLLGLYCPWDLNMTWNSSPSENYLMEAGYLEQMIADGDADIIKTMCNRYWSLRDTDWSDERLMAMLDCMENDIFGSGAYLRERERWPDGNYAQDVERGLDDFKNIVLARVHETDLYYSRLEENAGESYYILRSLQYKDFRNYNFIVGIGNHDLFKESEYRDLMEYIGIDIEQIDDSIKFIAVNAEEGKVEYIDQSINMGDSMVTCAGTLYINPEPLNILKMHYVDGVYSVYVDDQFSFDTNDYLDRDLSLILIGEGKVRPFNFSKDFHLKEYENHIY